MKKIFLILLSSVFVTFCFGQTPYIYFHWTVSDNDSISRYSHSFKCGYKFKWRNYYETCAKIEKRDSSFFIGKSSDSRIIYDLIITDSISGGLMLIRINEPMGSTTDINIGDIQFQQGYFEPELIPGDIENGIKYFSLKTDWCYNPKDFKNRTLKTGQDKIINKQLKTAKQH